MRSEKNCEVNLSPKTDEESPEVMVVSFADACAQPNAVVVPFKHAVAAVVAVRRPRRSKYFASFTVLQLSEVVSLHVDVIIKDLDSPINVGVSLGH